MAMTWLGESASQSQKEEIQSSQKYASFKEINLPEEDNYVSDYEPPKRLLNSIPSLGVHFSKYTVIYFYVNGKQFFLE